MQRILHIIDNLTLGGAETLLLASIRKMPEYEHYIILLTPHVHFTNVASYASIVCVEHKGWQHTFRTRSRLRELIRRYNPVVIHSHLFLSSFLSRLAISRHDNFFYSIHNLYSSTIFKSPVYRLLEKKVYRSWQKPIAVSEYVLNDYKKVIPCQTGSVLYNFIDDCFLEAMLEKKIKAIPEKWIAIGSFKEQKNYEVLIACIEMLHLSQKNKNITLDIYGDGPLRNKLEKRIASLPFISLKGRTSNLCEIMDQYDAFVSISKFEGYGIAPMEALARGLPLFLSDIPVYREIYKGHAFFIKLDEEIHEHFINVFKQYCLQSNLDKEDRKKKGHEYAKHTASGKAYINRLLQLYKLPLLK